MEDNILFGRPVKQCFYQRVLQACALNPDIDMFPARDKTEIGFSGVNLSGGQKQRIAIARAVYGEAQLVLLDNPLSSVDSNVGKHLFDNVIGPAGILQNKTRICVTHDVNILPQCDNIIIVRNGKIDFQGPYHELSREDGDVKHLLRENIDVRKHECNADLESGKTTNNISMGITENSGEQQCFVPGLNQNDTISITDTLDDIIADTQSINVCTNIITEEQFEKGQVSINTYLYYLKSFGILSSSIVIFMAILSEGSSMGSDYWLNIWSDGKLGDPGEDRYRNAYLTTYGLFGMVMAILTGSSAIYFAIVSLRASSNMHRQMLERILKSPIIFFDSTPVGRIMNRCAADISLCDNTLPDSINELINLCLDFVGTVVVILTVIPAFGAIILPVSIIFFVFGWLYVRTARQLRRIVSISRSPIYSHFSESLEGVSIIRAFDKEERFVEECEKRIDFNHKCSYPGVMANRWLELVCQTIGNLITFAVAIFVVTWGDSVQPGEVGMILTNAMMINYVLPNLVTAITSVETNIIAVERIKEYSNLNQEGSSDLFCITETVDKWPENGEICFEQYSARYREGLDLALNGVSCTIKSGEKVGVIGRTGAGKSSLAMAIFRLFESSSGRICIDKKDIANIDLMKLRSIITIIPQDPILFSGTIRMNLDPESKYTDEEVFAALKSSHLEVFITSLENGLNYEITPDGDNLSVGQRQLVCLARAILRKNKILILDEATASVDIQTDSMIQETIREKFKNNTVITIAHRIDTILDYDRIMVLDKGELVAFGTIDDLVYNDQSILSSMLESSNIRPRKRCSSSSSVEDTAM